MCDSLCVVLFLDLKIQKPDVEELVEELLLDLLSEDVLVIVWTMLNCVKPSGTAGGFTDSEKHSSKLSTRPSLS